MKNVFLFIGLLCPILVNAQRGKWEYMGNGNAVIEERKAASDSSSIENSVLKDGKDSIKTVARNLKDPENKQIPSSSAVFDLGSDEHPSPRSATAAWSDKKGNMYVFSGLGEDEDKQYGSFTDIWKYELKEARWVLLGGDRKLKGKLNKDNVKKDSLTKEAIIKLPPSRTNAATWADKFGNLYLFGGAQIAETPFLNDFWKFDIKTLSWEELSLTTDDKKANRAVLPESPTPRTGTISWTDSKGDFWLFGGSGYGLEEKKMVYFDELWKYEPNKKSWSLKSSVKDKKKSEIGLRPSARAFSAGWYDEKENKLWLFGGYGLNKNGNSYGGLSDMWFFDVKNEIWKIHIESDIVFENANLHIITLEDPKVTPGYRHSAITWEDNDGQFWLYGGQSSTTKNQLKVERNIWKFNPKSGNWCAIYSNNAPSVMASGVAFVDESNSLWLFGGVMIDDKFNQRPTNKMWKFKEEKLN